MVYSMLVGLRGNSRWILLPSEDIYTDVSPPLLIFMSGYAKQLLLVAVWCADMRMVSTTYFSAPVLKSLRVNYTASWRPIHAWNAQ